MPIIIPLTSPESATPPEILTPRLRLEFLDGLRGLAALYVLCYHCASPLAGFFEATRTAPGWIVRFCAQFLNVCTAHYAVDVFLILSGFCLMLPAARSADGRLPGGVWNYLGRRARRILPPFYVALVFSLLFPIVWKWSMHMVGRAPGESHGHLLATLLAQEIGSPINLLAHLFMLHNLNPAWIGSYNVPFWSVAPEWDFYFLLPALLLPLWRRFGAIIMVWAAFLIGAAPHVLLPSAHNFDWSFPWYLGLFALGMATAVLCTSTHPRAVFWRQRLLWGRMALGVFLMHAVVLIWCSDAPTAAENVSYSEWLGRDVVIGFVAASCILHCFQSASRDSAGMRSPLLRLLESRAAISLGAFSYSLYLTHFPFLMWPLDLMRLTTVYHLSPLALVAVRCGIGILLPIAFAYVFHLAFEKPFMTSPRRFVSLRAQPWMTKTFLFASASKAGEKATPEKLPT